jgi:hypothetical protein
LGTGKRDLEVIEESIEKGLVERQRNIEFNTSAACSDLLEILLHQQNLIDPGFTIKHEWIKSKNKIIKSAGSALLCLNSASA